MGLDMYLYANLHLTRFTHEDKEKHAVKSKLMDTVLATTSLDKVIVPLDENYQSIDVKVQAAYWRKANQIHKWFVDNVQGGEDNCGYYDVTEEQLRELRALCQHAIDTGDAKLLPPQEGFFFGNTDVDEYYWEDLRNTIKAIDRLLTSNLADVDYEYHSSW